MHTYAKEACPKAPVQHAPSPHTPAPRCCSVAQGLRTRTQPRGPDSALRSPPLPSPPPLSPGLVVPAACGEGFPERRNPDTETSGQVPHGLYRQHFSLLLRTKPAPPSPRKDADFKDQYLADTFFVIASSLSHIYRAQIKKKKPAKPYAKHLSAPSTVQLFFFSSKKTPLED